VHVAEKYNKKTNTETGITRYKITIEYPCGYKENVWISNISVIKECDPKIEFFMENSKGESGWFEEWIDDEVLPKISITDIYKNISVHHMTEFLALVNWSKLTPETTHIPLDRVLDCVEDIANDSLLF